LTRSGLNLRLSTQQIRDLRLDGVGLHGFRKAGAMGGVDTTVACRKTEGLVVKKRVREAKSLENQPVRVQFQKRSRFS
jgi:hypothetical protein